MRILLCKTPGPFTGMHWLSAVHWASTDNHYLFVPSQETGNTTSVPPTHTVLQEGTSQPTHPRTWLWWTVWVCIIIVILAVLDSCYMQGSTILLVCIMVVFLVCTCGGNVFYSLHGSWPWAVLFSGLVVWVATLSGMSPSRNSNLLDWNTCRYVPPSFY